MFWRRLYNVGSIASFVQWAIALGITLIGGGGLAAVLALATEVPVGAQIAMGVGFGLVVLGGLGALVARHTPLLSLAPESGFHFLKRGSQMDIFHVIGLLVSNALESGGERLTAKRVVPEVEILDKSGKQLSRYVGWAGTNALDFYPSGEQHDLYIAEKWHGQPHCAAVHGEPRKGIAPPLVGDEFSVRVVLRGNNLKRPLRRDYKLVNKGVDGSLQLEES